MNRLVTAMMRHGLLQQAAIVARTFRLDPLVVLDETNQMRLAVRLAAAQYVMDAEAEAVRKARG